MGADAAGSAGELLERDHRRIDEGFARFAESLSGPAVDRAAFHDAALALRHHIYIEEVHHFPTVKATGLMAPVLVMLREHGEIWDLLDALGDVLGNENGNDSDNGTSNDRGNDDNAAARGLWQQLATVLDEHNVKEERIVYPAGDEKLPPEAAATIATALAMGETPPGWTCQMAGRRAQGAP